MLVGMATKEYVDGKNLYHQSLGMNTLGNAFRIGLRKENADKACIFMFGSHNSEPFIALIRVSWNGSEITYNLSNILGKCNVRYTEMQREHVIIDIVTTTYGCAYVECTQPFYANFLGVS